MTLGARLRELAASRRAAQDRHAAAPRRPHDRFLALERAARRRSGAGVLASWATRAMHPRAGAVLDHAHQRAHARDHPRRPRPLAAVHRRDRGRRPALLPVDRGQGRALRRRDEPPDLPRARRPDDQRDLSERHLDVAAVRRAARARALDRRAASTRTSCGPATRSSTTTSIRARCKATLETKAIARPVLRRPDQRHDRLRGSRGAGPARRHQRRALRARRGRLVPAPRRGVPRRAGRRSRSRAASPSRTGCSRRAPSTGCSCARTTPTCGSPKPAARSASSTTRAGMRSRASATRSRASWSGCKSTWVNPATSSRRTTRARARAADRARVYARPTCCAVPASRMRSLMTLPGAGHAGRRSGRRRAGRDRRSSTRATSTASSDEIARQRRAGRASRLPRRSRLPHACAACRPKCSRSSTSTSRETIGQAARIPASRRRRSRCCWCTSSAASRTRRRRERSGMTSARERRARDGRLRRLAQRQRRSRARRGIDALRIALPRAQRDKLAAYLALLAKWNRTLQPDRDPRAGADGHASRARRARRAAASARSATRLRVLDVGSGGGVPGDSAGDRAARLARRRCSTPITRRARSCSRRRSSSRCRTSRSSSARVEDYAPAAPFDIVISRAFSDLATFVARARGISRAGRPARRDEGRVSRRGDRRSCRRHVRVVATPTRSTVPGLDARAPPDRDARIRNA